MTVLPDPLSYTVPFRPVPFVINPAKNYRNHRIELEFIDELITRSGLDDLIIRAVVDELKMLKDSRISVHPRCIEMT